MSVQTSHELKGLESQLAAKQGQLATKKREREDLDRQCSQLLRDIAMIRQGIATLKEHSTEPTVTEHALLRWLERVNGINLQEVHDAILTATRMSQIQALKSCKLPTPEGVKLIVKDYTVVSVVGEEA